MRILVGISLLFILSLIGCKREVIPPDQVDIGKEYFPVSIGHFVEYSVDSIVFDDFNQKIDTNHMEFRDEISESFNDAEGRPSYVVDRYVRPDSTFAWSSLLSYYITATNFKLEVIEDNLRYIKLVFPVKLNTRWYGNTYLPTALNAELQWMDKWDYKYVNVNEPFQQGLVNMNNTLTVTEADYTEGDPNNPDAFSARTFSKEVYAKEVGLVYREVTRWVYQPSVVKFRKGFTLILQAIRHN
ncbi:MAG: hypothetical protein JNJ58_03615 [Chitinophagaceae bacterium]|nr:hypothetical protein [Chitinophagaceae bacterium]